MARIVPLALEVFLPGRPGVSDSDKLSEAPDAALWIIMIIR